MYWPASNPQDYFTCPPGTTHVTGSLGTGDPYTDGATQVQRSLVCRELLFSLLNLCSLYAQTELLFLSSRTSSCRHDGFILDVLLLLANARLGMGLPLAVAGHVLIVCVFPTYKHIALLFHQTGGTHCSSGSRS